KWNKPPVDACFCMSSKDAKGNVLTNAYDYAINVTTEFIFNSLIEDGIIVNPPLVSAHRLFGANCSYFSLGASCASIPIREINTYLASELFDHFSVIGSNMPTRADVEALAIMSLARDARSITDIYNSLFREVREGAGDDYAPYTDDWKFVRDYGNSEMITHYTNKTEAKL